MVKITFRLINIKCFLLLATCTGIAFFFLSWCVSNEKNVAKEWLHQQTTECEGNFVGYGNEFAVLQHVYFIARKNVNFQLHCQSNDLKHYSFRNILGGKNHLNTWLQELQVVSSYHSRKSKEYQQKSTLAVLRYEHANFYHQMTGFYNAFLAAKLVKIKPDDLNVLLLDRNAPSIVDKTWGVLFGNVARMTDIQEPVLYKKLVWVMSEYNSPMNLHSLNSLPYIQEFSHFFKTKYGAGQKSLDCNSISVLFIWRRDHVTHTGSLSVSVPGKIQNEEELVDGFQEEFPGYSVAGIQLDEHLMTDQVRWVSQTDILVGMHGAGLSHIMELPSHAGVLELYPAYLPMSNRHHFQAIARWRGLHYRSWQNRDPTNELENMSTRIPPEIVIENLKSLLGVMCGQTKEKNNKDCTCTLR